jgi:rod shape-determining protein MreC
MRSFFLFLIRYHVFFIFLLLEGLALFLVIRNNRYQQTFFVHSANRLTGDVLNSYNNFTSYFDLREVNDSLLVENARLRAMHSIPSPNDTSFVYQSDSSGLPLYTFIPATVINNSHTMPNNHITLNKGSRDGIRKDMGVVTSNGIVGIVKDVSEDFAVVLSVLHGSFHTRVAVKRNNEQGRLIWDGYDPTLVTMVDVSEPGELFEGDTIVTTSYSMAFPPGYPVGTLAEYGKAEGSNFYTITVKLTNDFSRLQYVYVVDYRKREEQTELEDQNFNHAGN